MVRRTRPSTSCKSASGYRLVAGQAILCLAHSHRRSLFRACPSTSLWQYHASSHAEQSLSEQEQKLVWATQGVPKPDLFAAKAGGTAWKSKPSWYIVGKQDRTVHPDLERAMAKRMGATTYELDSSHVPMLSQPDRVLDVIRAAAKTAHKTVGA